jgi:hypothetical protein
LPVWLQITGPWSAQPPEAMLARVACPIQERLLPKVEAE